MNILYTCDNNYVWLMGISMTSLFDNNKDMKEITVYLIGDNISDDNREKLTEIAEKYGRECIMTEAGEMDIPASLFSKRWPKSAYNRIYAGDYLPEHVEKIIYIDCDTIIRGSLEELWNTNIEDKLAAGVKDLISKRYYSNIGLDNEDIYINAGVLLLNIKELRKKNISNMIDVFFRKYGSYIYYADQDIINGIFKDKKGILKPQYNYMTLQSIYNYDAIIKLRRPYRYYSRQELESAEKNPVIIHYTTCMTYIRPWFKNSNHPYREVFGEYRKDSLWKNKDLKEMTQNKKKKFLFSFMKCMPDKMEYLFLGMIHSKILPFYIKIKGSLKK